MRFIGMQKTRAGVCLAVWLFIAGCGPTEALPEPAAPPGLGSTAQALRTDNGLTVNGLSFNGLSFNGLSFNGLSFNGLSTSAFASWFQQDPELANMVMRYLVHCAVPAGEVRTYAAGGQTYTWTGGLGLAPAWAGGATATLTEQQVVSACLAAHANKYRQHVPISVLGRRADGKVIPVTDEERKQFDWKESCFFGNLFTGQGVHAGNRGTLLTQSQSSARACAVVDNSGSQRKQCPPLVFVGDCSRFCTLDASGLFYAECRHGADVYRPLVTRLREQDIYRCGDGTCQVTESCGNANWYNSCFADCGLCK